MEAVSVVRGNSVVSNTCRRNTARLCRCIHRPATARATNTTTPTTTAITMMYVVESDDELDDAELEMVVGLVVVTLGEVVGGVVVDNETVDTTLLTTSNRALKAGTFRAYINPAPLSALITIPFAAEANPLPAVSVYAVNVMADDDEAARAFLSVHVSECWVDCLLTKMPNSLLVVESYTAYVLTLANGSDTAEVTVVGSESPLI